MIATDPIELLLSKLKSVKKTANGWKACCPAHTDTHPSLDISVGCDGRVLLIDRSGGYKAEQIVDAIGLTMADLFIPRDTYRGNGRHQGTNGKHVGNGRAAKARPLYATLEDAIRAAQFSTHDDKHPDGGKFEKHWTYDPRRDGIIFHEIRYRMPDGTKETRPIHQDASGYRVGQPQEGKLGLYRILADAPTVYVFESAKKSEAAETIGLPATNSPFGAQNAKKSDWSPVQGKHVVIIPDAGDAGETYAADVVRLAKDAGAASTVIVRLPGLNDGEDFYDWLGQRDSVEPEALKAQVEQLVAEARAAKEQPVDQDAQPTSEHANDTDAGEEPDELTPICAGDLIRDFPDLKPPVIDGLLRASETMNVISTSKSRKTWTMIGLSLAVRTGRAWLGIYPVVQGDVLYIDAELHRNTFSRRLHWVAQTSGILSDEFAVGFDIINLRGHLRDIYQLSTLFSRIPKGKYRIIVLDALYRLIPPGVEENSNSDMTPIYNAIDRYAEETGAAIIVVHHASKGNQSGKGITDVGAGAGAQSRATDSHLVLRDHEDDNVVVLEAAVRSFAPPNPTCLEWAFPVWVHRPDLDASKLRETSRRKPKATETAEEQPAGIKWTVDKFIESFIKSEPSPQNTVLARAEMVMTSRDAKRYLEVAIGDGKVHRWMPRNYRQGPIRIATIPQPVTDTGDTK